MGKKEKVVIAGRLLTTNSAVIISGACTNHSPPSLPYLTLFGLRPKHYS